jgi:hypothetical protein
VLHRKDDECVQLNNFIMAEDTFTRLGQLIGKIQGLPNGAPAQDVSAEKRAWRLTAGDEIASHTVVQPTADYWLIIADGPVWGHAVIQRQQEILTALTQTGHHPQALKVKVRPQSTPFDLRESQAESAVKPLDPESADLLIETADGLKSDNLAQALRRLSRHRSKESS